MSDSTRERYIKGHGRNLKDRSSYLHSNHNLSEELLAEIENSLGPGAKILEVGCGGGHAAAAMAALGFNVTATDISPVAVEVAKQNYPDIEFAAADALELDYPDSSFDAVIAIEFIEHLTTPKRFIHEAARLLRPHGLLFIKTPNRLLHDVYYRKTANVSVWHPSVMSRKEIQQMLAAEGLSVHFVKTRRIPDHQMKKLLAKAGAFGPLVKSVIGTIPVGLFPVGWQPSLIAVAKRHEDRASVKR